MKKITFSFLMFVATTILSISSSMAQAVITSESFDGTTFVPNGWSLFPVITNPQGAVWSRRTTGTQNVTVAPHSGVAMASFRSSAGAAGNTQSLISPVIDLSNRGTNNAGIRIWMFRDSGLTANVDMMEVLVNTTPDTTGAVVIGQIARNRYVNMPDTQLANGWYQYSFTFPSNFNSPTNYVMLRGVAALGNRMYVDDVEFDAFPPPCSGAPYVGDIVNSINTICNGGGTATLSFSSPLTGVAGLSYHWQYSTNPLSAFTDFGDTLSNTVTTPVLSQTTYFMCTVYCSYTGQTYVTTLLDSIIVSPNPSPTVTVTNLTGAVCPNSGGVTLVATGAVTYSWSPAGTISSFTTSLDSVLANPSASTNYTVIGTDSFGCTGTTNIPVQLSQAPAKQAILVLVGNDTVCSGATVILRGGPGGGGPGGANTFAWSDGKTTRNDTIIASTSTLYVVTVTNGGGCSTLDSLNLVVTSGTAPSINVTGGPFSSCNGAPVTMSVSGTGTSYAWSPANFLDTTAGTTVTATPTNTTNYTVTATLGNCTNSALITVLAGASPNLNPTVYSMNNQAIGDTVCAGTTVVLNALPFGGGGPNGAAYVWSDGKTTRRDTITPTTSGLYIVTATSNVGCTNTDSIYVTVVPAPVPAFTFAATGLTVNFTDASTGAMAYTWSFGDGTFDNTASPTHTYSADGTYNVTLTIMGACGPDSTTQTVTVASGVGINTIATSNFNVYPNPAADVIAVRLPAATTLVMTNVMGQEVMHTEIAAQASLNVNQLPAGVYRIKASDKQGKVYTANFVKQ